MQGRLFATAAAVLALFAVLMVLAGCGNDEDTPNAAEEACSRYADNGAAGQPEMQETNVTGVVHTVQMYVGDLRVGTCIVQEVDEGPRSDGFRLIALRER